ncbi:SOS response-associated peptidase [Rubrobacter aplysinae]|uniref:SOS response-associated peptidase n=1 Tax=Rubrobacter aplysinae TaxID=909625 RepID=UPI00064BF18E|nr:SOS response-associated peptidase [Rubrobacter aplysinae]
MCGRFTLTTPTGRLVDQFELTGELPELTPSYNIAPAQKIAAVAANAEGERRLGKLQWGLVPRWSRDPEIGSRMINARAETVAEKNSFKSAFKKRRCLIPADGFYEWARNEAGSGPKQPYYMRLEDGTPYAFAGLWESWESEDGRKIHSTTIITTEANELMSGIHHRMPVILAPESYATWLDTSIQEPGELMPLLSPYPSEQMEAYPVSTHINKPANDDPACVEPVGPAEPAGEQSR